MRPVLLAAFLALGSVSASQAADKAITPAEKAALRSRLNSLREQTEIEAEVQAADRKEMVRPAPKGFKPDNARRKIRVTLVPRATKIHVGESFWYRLELQNVGREPVEYYETPSYLKDGLRWDRLRWGFAAILPDGTRKKMILGRYYEERDLDHRPRRPVDIPNSRNMTEAETRAYARRDTLRRQASKNLIVTLRPGETLVSRPWRWVEDEEYLERFKRNETVLWPTPPGPFRELRTVFNFEKPGKYKVAAIFRDPAPDPPDEERLRRMEARGVDRKSMLDNHNEYVRKSFGNLESNWVELEVVP